jgi:transposase
MRATRDLLRRRLPWVRHRAELLTPVQHTNRQYHLPAIAKKSADQANRDGVAERFPDPAVQKSIEVDLALMGHDDALLRDLELAMVTTAKQHDAHTRYLLQTVPGLGQIRSLVLVYERHDMARFPRVQDCVSSGRLVTCAKASAGKRYGTSGTKIGHAYLTWAFSEAAVLFLRHTPAGQKPLVRLANKPGQGKALTVLAHQLARAVYHMVKRTTAFAREKFLRSSGRGAGEPAASLGRDGRSLATVLCQEGRLVSANPSEHLGPGP